MPRTKKTIRSPKKPSASTNTTTTRATRKTGGKKSVAQTGIDRLSAAAIGKTATVRPAATKPAAPRKKSTWVRPTAKQVKELSDSVTSLRSQVASRDETIKMRDRALATASDDYDKLDSSYEAVVDQMETYEAEHGYSNAAVNIVVIVLIAAAVIGWIV